MRDRKSNTPLTASAPTLCLTLSERLAFPSETDRVEGSRVVDASAGFKVHLQQYSHWNQALRERRGA